MKQSEKSKDDIEKLMNNVTFPDFFIAGAQKSGTTAIASLLNYHPKISVSVPKEPMFFCRDDVSMHSCFFMERPSEWLQFDWENNKNTLLGKYGKLFHKTAKDVLCGEASTTYMPAKRVPERISLLNPHAKVIFILRNPVDRAYSAYWHYVYKGNISRTLPNQLRFDDCGILSMGLYKKYIEHYLEFFPREQLYFEVFEEFVVDRQKCINKILQFLDVEGEIDIISSAEKMNRAKVPVFHRGQLVLNELLKILGFRYSAEDGYDVTVSNNSIFSQFFIKSIRFLSSHNFRKTKYKKIDTDLRLLLQEYFRRENNNLSDMIGIDLGKYWELQ